MIIFSYEQLGTYVVIWKHPFQISVDLPHIMTEVCYCPSCLRNTQLFPLIRDKLSLHYVILLNTKRKSLQCSSLDIHIIKLSIAICFNPQWIIIREQKNYSSSDDDLLCIETCSNTQCDNIT